MTAASVSVLIPSYNHAPFIERTLRSVFNQTLQPKKLIVIDDGSKDESVSVIERVLAGCPFDNQLIVRRNKGLSATLNEGFDLCSKNGSEYFAYLGSDDVWLPEFLEKRVAVLQSRPAAVLAFGHAFLIDEEDRIIDSTQNWTTFADGDMLPFLLKGEIPASPTTLYRCSSLRALGNEYWNESAKLEDYEMYLKLCKKGDFALDSSVLAAWRQHGWNVSSDHPLMVQEWIDAQDRTVNVTGLNRDELDRIQKKLKFGAAFEYLRRGRKKEAWQALRENADGAGVAEKIRLITRLLIPRALFMWNRNRKRNRFIAKYGKLNI